MSVVQISVGQISVREICSEKWLSVKISVGQFFFDQKEVKLIFPLSFGLFFQKERFQFFKIKNNNRQRKTTLNLYNFVKYNKCFFKYLIQA
jgi:hypothetical protein